MIIRPYGTLYEAVETRFIAIQECKIPCDKIINLLIITLHCCGRDLFLHYPEKGIFNFEFSLLISSIIGKGN